MTDEKSKPDDKAEDEAGAAEDKKEKIFSKLEDMGVMPSDSASSETESGSGHFPATTIVVLLVLFGASLILYSSGMFSALDDKDTHSAQADRSQSDNRQQASTVAMNPNNPYANFKRPQRPEKPDWARQNPQSPAKPDWAKQRPEWANSNRTAQQGQQHASGAEQNRMQPGDAGRFKRPERPEWANKRPQPPERPEWANKRPQPPERPDWAKQSQPPARPDWASKPPERPERPQWAGQPGQPPARPDWATPQQARPPAGYPGYYQPYYGNQYPAPYPPPAYYYPRW